MNSVHGWFSDNKEWIEFIAAARNYLPRLLAEVRRKRDQSL